MHQSCIGLSPVLQCYRVHIYTPSTNLVHYGHNSNLSKVKIQTRPYTAVPLPTSTKAELNRSKRLGGFSSTLLYFSVPLPHALRAPLALCSLTKSLTNRLNIQINRYNCLNRALSLIGNDGYPNLGPYQAQVILYQLYRPSIFSTYSVFSLCFQPMRSPILSPTRFNTKSASIFLLPFRIWWQIPLLTLVKVFLLSFYSNLFILLSHFCSFCWFASGCFIPYNFFFLGGWFLH